MTTNINTHRRCETCDYHSNNDGTCRYNSEPIAVTDSYWCGKWMPSAAYNAKRGFTGAGATVGVMHAAQAVVAAWDANSFDERHIEELRAQIGLSGVKV